MDFHFLLERYTWELDRKDRISAAVNFPVTVLVLTAGLLATLFSKRQDVPPLVGLTVVALLLAAAGSGFASAIYFMRSYHGTSYVYLPLLADLEMLWMQLRAQEDPEDEPNDEFTNRLRERIITATDSNTASNDLRQPFLERGNIALIWMTMLTSACGLVAFLSAMISDALAR